MQNNWKGLLCLVLLYCIWYWLVSSASKKLSKASNNIFREFGQKRGFCVACDFFGAG